MWFKNKETSTPTIVMICVSHCAQCQAPIYGPASMEVPRDIATDVLMKDLSAKVVNFCVCRQVGEEEMSMIGAKNWSGN